MEHPIDKAGGPTAVAHMLGITVPSVVQWRKRGIPIERCMAIERATAGRVMRWHLRPADWWEIWPELVGAAGAPAAVPQPMLGSEAAQANGGEVPAHHGGDRRVVRSDDDPERCVAPPRRRHTDPPELVALQRAPLGAGPEVMAALAAAGGGDAAA